MEISRTIPLYEQVYELLWDRIASGDIRPGERVKDSDWSNRLSVSRTPVREALRKLEHEQILTAIVGGGYELRRVTAEDLRMLYRCRTVLEGLAIREAIGNLRAPEVRALKQTIVDVNQIHGAEQYVEAFESNTEFHRIIVKACRNPYLIRLLDGLSRQIAFYRRTLINIAQMDVGADQEYRLHLERTQIAHRAIVAAVEDGNADLAGTLMLDHLAETTEDMDRVLSIMAQAGINAEEVANGE